MSSQERLLEMNRRVINGEEVSDEEYAELITALRQDRLAAASKPKETKRKKTSQTVSMDDLFA